MDLRDLLEQSQNAAIEGVHVACDARVLSYDAAKRTIDALPTVRRRLQDPTTGEVFYEDYPPLANVPVMWPTGGPFGLTLPLSAGDIVTLVFLDVSNAEFRASGQVSDPIDPERHGISYPRAFPGSFHDAQTFAASSATKAVLGHKTGARIEFTSTEIDAGPNGATLAHASETQAQLSALQTALSSIGGYLAGIQSAVSAATPSTPVTNGILAGYLAPLAAITADLAALTATISANTPTLPTTTLKGK